MGKVREEIEGDENERQGWGREVMDVAWWCGSKVLGRGKGIVGGSGRFLKARRSLLNGRELILQQHTVHLFESYPFDEYLAD